MQPSDNNRAGSVHGCTQSACLHAGFPTPYPAVGDTAGLHGSDADGKARRRKTGKQAVCARAVARVTSPGFVVGHSFFNLRVFIEE